MQSTFNLLSDDDGQLQYAFGTNPLSASNRPDYTMRNDASGLALSFIPASSTGGVTIGAETSLNLAPGSWQPVPRLDQNGEAIFRVAPTSDPRRFLRFSVSVP
ncbi:MAG: hypothetical protein EOP87_26185 [Verrucomicrobiaceae bacterium]|nr:MAG: hypothetical protein EOP87_26185 [Verrucomicrobiaceae bacterium]